MKNWAKALSIACLLELPLLSLFFMKHPSLEAGFARLLMWYHIVPLYVIGLFSYGLLHSDRAGAYIVFYCAVIAAQIYLVTVIISCALEFMEKLKRKSL
jgi:hypothetical protein